MRLNQLLLMTLGATMIFACKREGCTDQSAINYDEKAKNDDGSCQYEDGQGPNGASNAVELSGTIDTPETLENVFTNSSSVDYIVTGDLYIDAALTIEPGVRIVMEAGNDITINSGGSINATGTSDDKIYIVGEQNVSGYWGYIRFNNSNNPNNKLIHTNIKNAGGSTYREATVHLDGNSRLIMQNTSISMSERNGFVVGSKDAKLVDFENNYFDECNYPIRLSSLEQLSEVDFNTDFVNDNVYNVLYVGGATIEQPITINRVNGSVLLDDISYIESSVVFNEGLDVRFAPGARIDVRSTGSLNSNGTSGNRITLTGDQSTEGYWGYIRIQSNNSDNIFEYTDVSYGGGSSYRDANIYVEGGAQFSMGNCSVNHSASYGVDGSGTYTDLGGNTYSGNTNDDNTLN
ncbi:MAG: hypothetical protein WED10_10735 [Brumimicrobium sp.]